MKRYEDDFSESPFENMRELSHKHQRKQKKKVRLKPKTEVIQPSDTSNRVKGKAYSNQLTKRLTITVIVLIPLILIGLLVLLVFNKDQPISIQPSPTPSMMPTPTPTPLPTPTPEPTFDTSGYDTTSFGSATQIVNKKHRLNASDIPDDMVVIDMPATIADMTVKREVNDALNQLYADASSAGIDLYVNTGYIGYYYQATLFDQYVEMAGQNYALKIQPRQGYSEHQTGYAVDFISRQNGKYTRYNDSQRSSCAPEDCEENDAAIWLSEHGHEYGFIQRYPKGKEDITGYDSQWWHYRYVGVEVATYLHEHGLTMEEAFNVEGGDYQ